MYVTRKFLSYLGPQSYIPRILKVLPRVFLSMRECADNSFKMKDYIISLNPLRYSCKTRATQGKSKLSIRAFWMDNLCTK